MNRRCVDAKTSHEPGLVGQRTYVFHPVGHFDHGIYFRPNLFEDLGLSNQVY